MKRLSVGGYDKIPMDETLRVALTKCGLKVDQMQHSAWVPKWVKKAISVYRSGDGFAGMTLEEFLKCMKPEAGDAP